MIYSRSVNDGKKSSNRSSKRYSFAQRIIGDEMSGMSEDYQSDTFYTQLPSSPSHYQQQQQQQLQNQTTNASYSLRDDCSMTSCVVSLCLCMNFAAIVATVTLCLIFFSNLDNNISLDRSMYSRMVVFPTWKRFAHSVRFHKLHKSKDDDEAVIHNSKGQLWSPNDYGWNDLDTETMIYSLSSDPVVDPDAFQKKSYGPVELTALTSSKMNFEYWKFALNKESIVNVKSYVEYAGAKDKRTDVMSLDVVVGSDQFSSWQNQNRQIALMSLPLTSGIYQRFQFKLIKQQNDTSKQHGKVEDDSQAAAYISIPIKYSTETVFFIFNYAEKPHNTATKAIADFSVTYSNLMPNNTSPDNGTIINQCRLDEGECHFKKDSYPPYVLIRTNPNSFENDSFHFDYSVGLNMAKAMPISLSPVMGAVLFDVVYIFSFVVMYLCCGLKSRIRPSKKETVVDEYSSLIDNE